jgi:hypothetical protein
MNEDEDYLRNARGGGKWLAFLVGMKAIFYSPQYDSIPKVRFDVRDHNEKKARCKA